MTSAVDADGRPRSTSGHRSWLHRADLVVLPLVLLTDLLVFSRLLRVDGVTAAQRVAIVVFAGAGVALLAMRWRAPVLVFAATVVMAVPPLLVTDYYVPFVGPLVGLAAVAQLRSTRVSLICLAASIVPIGLLVGQAVMEASPQGRLTSAVGSTVFYTAGFLLAWGCGFWLGRHQRRLAEIQQLHTQEVQRQRELAEQAVSVERLRIARELHDIVAHAVTIMVLHAAGAQRVVRTDPDRAAASLATIENAGQQAMSELRRLLALLRDSGDVTGPADSFVPGLARVDQILDAARRTGVSATLEVTGEPRRLDASVDLAAYRLVQEAITNVTKHRGAGSRALVTIEWESEKVTVAVEDDGVGIRSGGSASPGGQGLAGLRERVAIAAGEFSAGPTDTGGFRVAARLPVSATQPIAGQARSAPVPAPPADAVAGAGAGADG